MEDEQRRLIDGLWGSAMQLLEAVTETGDVEATGRLLVPGGILDVTRQLFSLVPLYTLLYGHHPGTYVPLRYRPAAGGYWLEIVACTDPSDVQASTTGTVSLHLSLHDGGWRVTAIRPIGLDQDFVYSRLAQIYRDGEGDPWAIGLVVGALQAERVTSVRLADVPALALDIMADATFSVLEQAGAVRLWCDFQATGIPELKDPAPWAAGLEYLIGVFNGRPISRQTIARSYGVDVQAMGWAQQAIREALHIGHDDRRYAVFDRPPVIVDPLLI